MSEPRRYSDVKAERAENDPVMRRKAFVVAEINRLEAEARASGDPGLQCEAEELRSMLQHDFLVPEQLA